MIDLKKLQDSVRKSGLDPDKLGVLLLGGNNEVFGEIENLVPRDDGRGEPAWVRMKNPKQFLRLQQMTNQGVSTNFLVGDLDMVETGTAYFKPVGFYFLKDLGDESNAAMLALFLDFIERKQESSAKAAGLVLPDRVVRPLK